MMITRREFNFGIATSALSLPFSRALAVPDASWPNTFENNFSTSLRNFTPFGYLDNPYHAWDLHPSGVFRSLPGIGFGLYFPAGPGGYFDEHRNGIYQAHLQLGFVIDDHLFLNPEDFSPQKLISTHHSKNIFTYRVAIEGTECICTFFQIGENALAARVDVKKFPPDKKRMRLVALHQQQLGGAQWWGGDGMTAAYHASPDAWTVGSFAAGTVFALHGDAPSQAHIATPNTDATHTWLHDRKNIDHAMTYGTAPLQAVLIYDITPQTDANGLTVYLSRGTNRKNALEELKRAKNSAATELLAKYEEDAKFWQKAPILKGDWPLHWKNGWIYDFETLRMMVRQPLGEFSQPWDGMQIQSPRSVLAEGSIDMWTLSFADPETAKAVFVGQFVDAIAPNVPCAREDGVANMIAVDGSECGTAISWCYPFFCAQSIYQRTWDRSWLKQLYPHLAAFLQWTLKHRTDSGGFIVAKCSWESGMDGSRRFLIQEPTGGELTEFARLVELQAATSQAALILLQFAKALGKTQDEAEWTNIRDNYAAKTQHLWNGKDWFHDFDTRTMQPVTSVGRDAGQAAPIFCGLTNSNQTASMVPTLREISASSQDGKIALGQNPLIWPSLALPYFEALWVAQEFELLAEDVYLVADRIYTSMDRREVTEDPKKPHARLGWPGVSCEMWGNSGAVGGEAYGWGAVMPAHIIRNLVGIRETSDPNLILLSPNLPKALMVPGKTYVLENMPLGPNLLSVQYYVRNGDELEIQGTWPGAIHVEDATGKILAAANSPKVVAFQAKNHSLYRIIRGDISTSAKSIFDGNSTMAN